jgi:chromosome segregation ATPase
MKNFQQSLLITLALGLCALCAWQWYLQTGQRNRIDSLDQRVYQQAVDIQGYTNSLVGRDAEIAGQQARINQLKQAVATNEQASLSLKRDLLRLEHESEGLSNEIVQYQSLTNLLATRLTQAYAGIKKQNEAISNLVSQRDEFVAKFNDSVKSRNEIVEKYNDLVREVEKRQAAAASNSNK